jgi:hypothetical protein
MMKRYIKTPLKYALPLLFIGSLALVSISGCTSSTNSPTATPTATPSAAPTTTASFDPLLAKVATALKSEGYTANEQHNNPSINADDVAVDFTDAHNNTCTYIIRDDGAAKSVGEVQVATPSSGDTSEKLVPANDTNFGLQAATVAFGHTPTVTEVYNQDKTGENIDMDYIAYTYGSQGLYIYGSITAPS